MLDIPRGLQSGYKYNLFRIESLDDAARLETDGKGESEPLAKNDSAVNKAKNRRVEFISIKN